MPWIFMGSERKVIFLVGNLGSGGLERFVARVSMEAARQSLFTPVVICLDKKEGLFLEPLVQRGIRVLQAPLDWQRSLMAIRALRYMIRQENAAVVHSQVNFSLIQQLLASWLACSRFMVTERNTYPLRGISRFRRVVQFYVLKLAGVRYSANSPEVAIHVSRLVRYPLSKIQVIPNGVELPDLSTYNRMALREVHGWKNTDFVIGYVARFAEHKGHSYFIRVMAELHQLLGTRLKICFIGDGPTREIIQKKCETLGLGQISLFAGVVSAIDQYYAAFDCGALLSEYEGMPNVVVEAMSFGLPVVANPVGNVVELFQDGAGLLNDTVNPEDTAQFFLRLSESIELRNSIGSSARSRIHQRVSISNTMGMLIEQYGFD